MTDARVNLLGLTRPELEAWCVERGGKAFRARQLFQWIYKRAETDFAAMTDLAKDFRADLSQVAEIRLPEIITRQDAADGTVKWMLKAGTGDGASQGIEMVFIPEDRPRHAVHLLAGRLRDGLQLLLHRAAGLQPQPHHRRDRRPGAGWPSGSWV
jgi:hypothetical protein